MESVLSIMINLISNHVACLLGREFKTTKEKYETNKLECRLWKAIEDTIKQGLKLRCLFNAILIVLYDHAFIAG